MPHNPADRPVCDDETRAVVDVAVNDFSLGQSGLVPAQIEPQKQCDDGQGCEIFHTPGLPASL
jgi:hypothetical protein